MRFFNFCGMGMALISILLVSCSKNGTETADRPSVTLTAPAFTFGAEGGSYSLSYSVANPADDGYVLCYGDVSWLSDFIVSSAEVTFTLEENMNEGMRTGNVVIEYIYTDGSSVGNAIGYATVEQYGIETPDFSVQSEAVTASYGGGNYSFTYTLSNAVKNGEITCESDASWISGFDYSKDGSVGFSVAANEGSDLRTATITAVYSYGNGGEIAGEVTVVQDNSGDVDVSSIVGTYTASALCSGVTGGEPVAETWTMTIYQSSATEILIDGLLPAAAGYYPGSKAYLAEAYLNEEGQIVVPTQVSSYIYSYYNDYIGWTPALYENDYWIYSFAWPDCTFTYNESTDTWESDYGESLGMFYYTGGTGTFNGYALEGFINAAAAGITLKKTSGVPSSADSSPEEIDISSICTDIRAVERNLSIENH